MSLTSILARIDTVHANLAAALKNQTPDLHERISLFAAKIIRTLETIANAADTNTVENTDTAAETAADTACSLLAELSLETPFQFTASALKNAVLANDIDGVAFLITGLDTLRINAHIADSFRTEFDIWHCNRWKDALTLACACGHLEIVELLMTHFHTQEDDYRPHPGDISYPTCLSPWVSWVKTTSGQNQETHEKQLFTIACSLGRTNVAQWFMTRGIFSKTAFCEACREGHIDIVRLLIAHIDPEFVLTYPLSDAAKRGHTDIVQLFIDTAAHCEMISLNRDAMQNACSFGHVNVVRLLLTVIDMDKCQVRDNFQIACVNGHIEVARLLFSLIDKVDTYNGNFIHLFFEQVLNVVCIRGHLEIVRLLLPFVKNLAGGYKNACSSGQTHVVSFLLEHGVYSSDDHDSALYLACVGLHGGVLRVLFEYAVAHPHIGIDPSSNLQTVFVRATLACRMDVVELLLLWRPYARAWFVSSAHLNTALITAFQLGTGYSTVIRLLLDLPLEFGVNPALDANHLLAVAIRMRNTEYVRMLLDLPQERGVVALPCHELERFSLLKLN